MKGNRIDGGKYRGITGLRMGRASHSVTGLSGAVYTIKTGDLILGTRYGIEGEDIERYDILFFIPRTVRMSCLSNALSGCPERPSRCRTDVFMQTERNWMIRL